MSPVEHTTTSVVAMPSGVTRELAHAPGVTATLLTVAALALPLEHDGRGMPSTRCARLTCIGAAHARLVVNMYLIILLQRLKPPP